MRLSLFFVRSPLLKLHDKGPKVKEASELLAKHGSKLQPTDYFSLAMRSAVLSFQKKHNINQTAEINKETWKQLRKKHKVS